MNRILLSFALLAVLPTTTRVSQAADRPLAPASERFSGKSGGEELAAPDFQRHVIPLLSRAGCNTRDCHGSFKGKGGLQLSLFGYDYAADHRSLTAGEGDSDGPRIDPSDPTRSLLLLKPTKAEPHKGGERFAEGSWQYRLLHRWIVDGAPKGGRAMALRSLAVEPTQVVLDRDGDSTQLRVVATWEDGWQEDVTCLSRFDSADDVVAEVDAEGRVVRRSQGDTHVIVFYGPGVSTVPVIAARPGPEPSFTEARNRTRIDELVEAKLRQLGIEPSPVCDDATFLRRASIDLTGTLPTPAEIEAFLADANPGKRDRKIDELLGRPAYAAWWANRLCDFTGADPESLGGGEVGQVFAVQWHRWLYERLLAGKGWDEMAAGIVVATSREPGESYGEYAGVVSQSIAGRDGVDFRRAGKPAPFLDATLGGKGGGQSDGLRPCLPRHPPPVRPVPQASLRSLDHGRLPQSVEVLRVPRPRSGPGRAGDDVRVGPGPRPRSEQNGKWPESDQP